jgi:hypothetical protein
VKLTFAAGLFVATATAAAFAQAPGGASPTQGTAPQQQRQTPPSPQQNSSTQTEQTVTGCLTAAGSVYTLTVMDDSGTPGSTAETTAYTLTPGSGVDLQPHVNKRVTVKGTDAGPQKQDSTRVVENTPPAPAATGTSGTGSSASGAGANGANAGAGSSRSGATPTVQTTAKARINAKTLNVTNVAPATGSCGAQ